MSHSQLKVRNWEQFQHYKDRNPPWIKLHFALLASEDWVTLDDASKLLAVVCMLVASRNNGFVPNNPAYLKRVAYLDRLPKLKPLIDCGFLEIPQADASAMQAPASVPQADARPETETEAEKKEIPACDKRIADDRVEQEFTQEFWPAYPRKVDRKDALKAFRKARASADLQAIMAALKAYCAEVDGKDKQYVRHGARWLNAAPWEDAAANSAAVPKIITDEDWQKRLKYGRERRQWHVGAWGPFPGASDCRVPEHLLQPSDGQGWAVWEA